jgi:hypothetical protein
MMTELYAKLDIAARLKTVQAAVHDTVAAMTPEQFERVTGEEWPAADYLKHLILSVKPFARVVSMPLDKLRDMFGVPDRDSMSYEDFVELYHRRLGEGMRAELVPAVTPVEYRLPPDMTDLKSTLLTAWNEGNDRLIAALETLDEASLDSYQLPHPAVGLVTLREMLYFTVYHNNMHWRDIERVGA